MTEQQIHGTSLLIANFIWVAPVLSIQEEEMSEWTSTRGWEKQGMGNKEEGGVGEWYFRVGVLKSFPFKKLLSVGAGRKVGMCTENFPFFF